MLTHAHTFTPDDLALIARIGELRQQSKDRRAIADRKVREDASGADIHTIGFAAELALCRFLGVQPNTTIGPRGHQGRSVRAFGKALNTHYNSRSYGDLRYFPNSVPNVDALVLVTGTLPTLTLMGWVSRDIFDRAAIEEDLPGRGRRLLYLQRALWPMAHLIAWLRDDCPIPEPAPVARQSRLL